LGNGVEEDDLLAVVGFDGEDVGIELGDVQQGGIQRGSEVFVVLPAPEGGEEVLGPQPGGAGSELHEEEIILVR